MALRLMALLPIDDLHGPTYSASLRPRSRPSRSRPAHTWVGIPVRHRAAAVLMQDDTDPIPDVMTFLRSAYRHKQCLDLGHAIAVSGAQSQHSTHISCYTPFVHKSLESYKRPWPKAKLQDTNMLKVLICLRLCKRRNLD
jgi:hypothetical protein